MKKGLLAIALATPLFALAQTESVKLLTDLPLIGDAPDLAELLQGLFKLALGVAVTAAVVIIVWNGIRYMTTDIVESKGDAKKWIQDVIWGLVLAFASVLILSTINPRLTQFDFISSLKSIAPTGRGETVPPQPPGGGGGGTTDPAQEAAVRAELALHNITVNKAACKPGQTKNCTNVGDLPRVAIDGLIGLASDCGCSLLVTGGTEGAGTTHQTHGPGKPMVDLRRSSDITSFIQNNGTFLRDVHGGPLYSYNGSEFWDEPSSEPHWHACFGTQCAFQ